MCFNHHLRSSYIFFFFNDTATTEIYTLSLHDALPISGVRHRDARGRPESARRRARGRARHGFRSEEHTSELQSQSNLVCRLLLEKKKKKRKTYAMIKKSMEIYSDHTPLELNSERPTGL